MSDYICKIGDDYDSDYREYVTLDTSKGVPIAVALSASGIPFKGRFDKETIFFSYDGHYKDSVQEIMDKFTSDKYADQRNEIEEHRKKKDYLYFLPAVAKLLRMTEGTLRRRPADIQLSLCKRYADNWYCDTYTIQHELRDALMLITKPELTDGVKEKAVGKDYHLNTTSAVEKRDKAVDYVNDEGIKVKVSYPDDVPENIRQQKINKMYDIFLGAMRRNGTEETTE